jgi:hypothetical protein
MFYYIFGQIFEIILGEKEVMFFCEKVKKEDIEIHFLRKVKGINFAKSKNYVYNVYYVYCFSKDDLGKFSVDFSNSLEHYFT